MMDVVQVKMTMNFSEFERNFQDMKKKLEESNINPETVKIEYTKFDGYNCIWAMKDDIIITYFKW